MLWNLAHALRHLFPGILAMAVWKPACCVPPRAGDILVVHAKLVAMEI